MKYNRINYIYIFVTIFTFILFSQFSKCFNRKNEMASSLINLKTKGVGNISIYSKSFKGTKPNIVIINNAINYTDNQSDYHYSFSNSESNNNNITLIWNEPINITDSMFEDCSSITEIDLSHFDSSEVTSMKSMFLKCSSLISLNLSNFNTSKVENMNNMFSSCSSLNFLNLSSFDTGRVKLMGSMFSGLSSLNSLDISNFDTSNVTVMEAMFAGCSSLTSLNLSNFNTSSVEFMKCIFCKCSLLNSLDLSNFDASRVNNLNFIFDGCTSLTYLDLSNSNSLEAEKMSCIFKGCEKLELVNSKLAKINSSMTFTKDCQNHPEKLTICSESDDWQTLFNLSEKHYIYCINSISSSNNKKIGDLIKCFNNNIELDNPCIICGQDYFKKGATVNDTISCYKSIEGYYFDDDISDYKSCYNSCKKYNTRGNETHHNCIECKDGFKIELNLSIYKNCYLDINSDFYNSININTQISNYYSINSSIKYSFYATIDNFNTALSKEIENKNILTNQLSSSDSSSPKLSHYNTYLL